MWLVWIFQGAWVGPFQCQSAFDVFNTLDSHNVTEVYQKWHVQNGQWAFDGASTKEGLAFPLVMENVIFLESPSGPGAYIQKQ